MPGDSSATDGDARLVAHQVLQRIEQPAAIVVHRPDRRALEQLRKRLLHELPVLQHVRHAGRAAQIVFQHVVSGRRVSRTRSVPVMWHQTPRGGFRPTHCGRKPLRRRHHVLRQHAVADDPLLVVQVVDQHVERGDPLPQAALQHLPFVAADDPRHDVERNDPLAALPVAVHVERDAELHHRPVGRPLTADQVVRRDAADAMKERLAIGPRLAGLIEHFVVELVGLVLEEPRFEGIGRGRVARQLRPGTGHQRRLLILHVDPRASAVLDPRRWVDLTISDGRDHPEGRVFSGRARPPSAEPSEQGQTVRRRRNLADPRRLARRQCWRRLEIRQLAICRRPPIGGWNRRSIAQEISSRSTNRGGQDAVATDLPGVLASAVHGRRRSARFLQDNRPALHFAEQIVAPQPICR